MKINCNYLTYVYKKIFQGSEPSRSEETSFLPVPPDASTRSTSYHKANTNTVFDSGFLTGPVEENVQDILDQHISRVFDSGQETPAHEMLPPTVPRPSSDLERSRIPIQGSNSIEPPEYPCKHNIKYRRVSIFNF